MKMLVLPNDRLEGRKKEHMRSKIGDEMKKMIESLIEDSKEFKDCSKNHKREKEEELARYGQLQVLQSQMRQQN